MMRTHLRCGCKVEGSERCLGCNRCKDPKHCVCPGKGEKRKDGVPDFEGKPTGENFPGMQKPIGIR